MKNYYYDEHDNTYKRVLQKTNRDTCGGCAFVCFSPECERTPNCEGIVYVLDNKEKTNDNIHK